MLRALEIGKDKDTWVWSLRPILMRYSQSRARSLWPT